jgi:hypothetical protein
VKHRWLLIAFACLGVPALNALAFGLFGHQGLDIASSKQGQQRYFISLLALIVLGAIALRFALPVGAILSSNRDDCNIANTWPIYL